MLEVNDFNPKTVGYLNAFVDSPMEAMDKLGTATVCIVGVGGGPLIVPGTATGIENYFNKQLQELSPIERDLGEDERVVEYSFGPTNSIISTFLARDIIMFLMGAKNIPSLGKRVEIDLTNMCFSETT